MQINVSHVREKQLDVLLGTQEVTKCPLSFEDASRNLECMRCANQVGVVAVGFERRVEIPLQPEPMPAVADVLTDEKVEV